jgi:hypothetical protein
VSLGDHQGDTGPSAWGDAFFLGYCEDHSRTERALFHRRDVRRVLLLAGFAPSYWLVLHALEKEFWSVGHETMGPLVKRARRRMACQGPG